MRTTRTLALAAALALAAPVTAHAGGWHGHHHHHGHGHGAFWAGVGAVGGLIGLGILADALTRPDVVYVAPPPPYEPPPPYWDGDAAAADAETRERDAYLAGYAAGREDASAEPYYPAPRTARTRTAPR